jgi:hypothetical protein
MHDERYIPTDQQEKETIRQLKNGLAYLHDFLEYLFEHSEHCNHISLSDAQAEFEAWDQKRQEDDV